MEFYKMRTYAPEGAVFISNISLVCLIVMAGCLSSVLQPFFSFYSCKKM